MNISYPKRDYELFIQTSKWNLFLKYQQSNALWTIEFLNKTPGEQVDEIIDLLRQWQYQYFMPKKWYISNKKHYWYCKIRELQILNEILQNKWQEIIDNIKDTLHKKYISVFENVNIPNAKRKTLFSSNIMALCKEYNIPWPEILLKDYTMEQIEWMFDGMLLHYNEHTKEWQASNDIALSKTGGKLEESEINKIKNFREQMQKK